jgi:hypothetical protein
MVDWLKEKWWLFHRWLAFRTKVPPEVPASIYEMDQHGADLVRACDDSWSIAATMHLTDILANYHSLLDVVVADKLGDEEARLKESRNIVVVDKNTWDASTMKKVGELEDRISDLEDKVGCIKKIMSVCSECEGEGSWVVETERGRVFTRTCSHCVHGYVIDDLVLEKLAKEGELKWLESR